MRNLEATTKLNPEKVVERLKDFFGPGGLGLDLTDEAADCLTFSGGGGYVTADLRQEGGRTKVGLVTQEWEAQIDKFAAKLP